MTRRATITLDDDVFYFLQAQAGKNRSGFINALLRREQQASLSASILKANEEEASDVAYQSELAEWDATLSDGLTW